MSGSPSYDKVLLSSSKFIPDSSFNVKASVSESKIARSYLHHACHIGHLTGAKQLLKLGGCLSDRGVRNETPLIAACITANIHRIELIEWILSDPDGRSTINECDIIGMTALHWAAFYNNVPIVKLLLHNGADPTLFCDNTPSRQAFRMKHIPLWLFLRKQEQKRIDHISIGEWRPSKHSKYRQEYRTSISTLMLLAKISI